MRIFITGASGCIGHYVTEKLIQQSDHELFLLVRNPDRLKFDVHARSGIHLLKGDLDKIEEYAELLATMEVAILLATSWGGEEESYQININKTLSLLNSLDPNICQKVIYFSTASILGQDNQPLQEAGELGTLYVRTKYLCYSRLNELAIAPKITTIFPTLVFGGDGNKPYSHISGGLPDILKLINLIRFFKADGSFHFIHSEDIARVVKFLVDHPQEYGGEKVVLGNQPTTVDQAVEQICQALGKKIYFRIPLSFGLANFFIVLFRLKMEPWDRFCLDYRHFTYNPITTPETLGLENYAPKVKDLLR
ncbi:MAG: NAD(P)-dependent oxidoreductase [Cyanobacteriota bacterium ELA615]